MASQGHGRSQSHTSHSITGDGVTGKCQPTHKEEPSAHRIIRLPGGGAILHSHDSSLSTHTLFFYCISESIFLSRLFNGFNCVVCSGSYVFLRVYCIFLAPVVSCHDIMQASLWSSWGFYGPLVHGVAWEFLIYKLIIVKHVSWLTVMHLPVL